VDAEQRAEDKSMNERSDTVIERVRVREVTGVFVSREALDAAVEMLLHAGFDRSDIDVMAGTDRAIPYIAAKELADVPWAPRQAYVERADITAIDAMGIAILSFAGAAAAAFAALASGGSAARAGIWALAVAAVAAGAGYLIVRSFRRRQEERLAQARMLGGLILWVRVRSPEREERAQAILSDHGAEAVRTHEIEIDKRAEDLPLSSLRPDPWLGDERLGQL
jgi:hypothetical protein